jgi:hypothetical protein
MYSAKHFASAPVVIGSPATSHVGRSMFFRPAAAASCLIAPGVMSDEPTMASRWMLSRTSLRPARAIAIAPIPKATSTTPARAPPISKIRFMTFPP